MSNVHAIIESAQKQADEGEREAALNALISEASTLDSIRRFPDSLALWEAAEQMAEQLGDRVTQSRMLGKSLLRAMAIGNQRLVTELANKAMSKKFSVGECGVAMRIAREASDAKSGQNIGRLIVEMTQSTLFDTNLRIGAIPSVTFDSYSQIIRFVRSNYPEGIYKVRAVDCREGTDSNIEVKHGDIETLGVVRRNEDVEIE